MSYIKQKNTRSFTSFRMRDEKKFFTPHLLPSWFRQELPNFSKIKRMKTMLRGKSLATVCEGAHCPNMGQCWGKGVATFMILGEVCTRSCRFCAVGFGEPSIAEKEEPKHIAEMVKELRLKYVVITSVTRDDLDDEGSDQFIRTVEALREYNPSIKIELLIPDFSGRMDLIKKIVAVGPDVIGHNIEMAERLFSSIRPQADYQRSLDVLRTIKKLAPKMLVKSGFMVGLGESNDEVEKVLCDIKMTDCDMLTIGQYLSPSKGGRHVAVDRFVSPEVFEIYKDKALGVGFRHVFSAPLVRSSYIAEEGYRSVKNG